MKIYFEDGVLDRMSDIPVERYSDILTVKADYGPTMNRISLDYYKDRNPDAIIYTNSIFAFHNKYAWNEELKVPEIYIRTGHDTPFVRIDQLTNRELRQAHNLARMYIAGAFSENKKGE